MNQKKIKEKDYLNSILRLRLFYSTEKELSDIIGYKLKGNHFNKFKKFQAEAYFCKFTQECDMYTQGEIELEQLLIQYETTSKFFINYIKKTKFEENKAFVPYLLNYLFLDNNDDGDKRKTKEVKLCQRFYDYNRDGNMNVGILILLTYGLVPTFNNKTAQDIPNIIEDYKTVYNILLNISLAKHDKSSTKYTEMLCLKEMRRLIEEEEVGDHYLNRILLIHITNDVINRIYALMKPIKYKEFNNKIVTRDFDLYRLWRCPNEADNIIWEFVKCNNAIGFYLYRHEIDYKKKRVGFVKYHLTFQNIGIKDICATIIKRPSFDWHNILKKEQPEDSLSFDYTFLEFNTNESIINKLSFSKESPIGLHPMTLIPVVDDSYLFYTKYIDRNGQLNDFTSENQHSEYEVEMESLTVAVSNESIIFKHDDCIYKMDKYSKEGKETIPGIGILTNNDNFIWAKLHDAGKEYCFLLLDSINQSIMKEDLLCLKCFRKIENLNDIFKNESQK